MKYYERVGFYGKSGVGKDYCVNKILEYFNTHHLENYRRISFSDQLKKCGNKIFGDWLKEDYPPEVKELPLNVTTSIGEKIEKTPREIWLSLNHLRDIEDTLFIRMLSDEMYKWTLQGQDMFIISDIRTYKELKFCKDNGFRIIKIESDFKFHKTNEFDTQQLEFKELTDAIFLNQKDDFNLKLLLEMIKK